MTGSKLMLFGCILLLAGIGLFAMLSIPTAPAMLAGIFTTSPATPLQQAASQLDPDYIILIINTIRIVGTIGVVLCAVGLLSAFAGLLRRG